MSGGKEGEADAGTALAPCARAGAGARNGREPAALSQPVRVPQPDAAAHEAHRVERAVRDHVGRGFSRAAPVYGAHGMPRAYRAAAGRALCRGAPAAAVHAVGRFFAARADLVDAVQPRLGDRNGFEPGAGRGRGDAAAGQPRRAHRRADPLDRRPEHPVEDIADAAQYDLFRAQHPRQQRDHTGGRRGAAGGEIRPERGDQGGGRAGRGDQKRTCAGRAGGCAAGRRGADRGYADQRSYAADPGGGLVPPDACARRGRGVYPAHRRGRARPGGGGKTLHRQGPAAVRPCFRK